MLHDHLGADTIVVRVPDIKMKSMSHSGCIRAQIVRLSDKESLDTTKNLKIGGVQSVALILFPADIVGHGKER
jgi:hypothetical protein